MIPATVKMRDTAISSNIWKTLVYATAFNPPATVKNAAMTTRMITDNHEGRFKIWLTRMLPANSVNDNQDINMVTRVYHASMLRVDCPNRLPMNSGSVRTLAPRYRGAKTTARR